MIAMALLAVVMTGLMGGMRGTVVAQGFAAERELATALSGRLVERLGSIDWSLLMGQGGETWTTARYELDSGGAAEDLPLTEAELITAGVIPDQIGLANPRVYIEYYRALASEPTVPTSNSNDGLMERWDGTIGAHVPISYADESAFDDPGNLAACRYTGTLSGMEGQLLVIRVLVLWDIDGQDGAVGRLSKFFIRREDSDA